MADTVMAVEFGTIHHYSILEENAETHICAVPWIDIKLTNVM